MLHLAVFLSSEANYLLLYLQSPCDKPHSSDGTDCCNGKRIWKAAESL